MQKIDRAIENLNIKILLPENILSIAESKSRLNNIIKTLAGNKSKAFNPSKKALKELGVKLPKSKTGLNVDFASSQYLYPVKGSENNIVRIKLTGDDIFDKKLANYLSGFKRNPKNYTWHHLDDYDPITNTCTMIQLVETSIHLACNPHYGAVKIVEEFLDYKYLTR